MVPPAPAPCILLIQGPRSSQLQIQGFGVTRCGLALKSADPRAPQGDTSPSYCLAQGSSALQTPPTLLRAQEVWGHPSHHGAGGVRSPSPGLGAFQTYVSGSVYTCPWRRHPRTGSQVWRSSLHLCCSAGSLPPSTCGCSPLLAWSPRPKPPHFWEKGSAASRGLRGKGCPALGRRAGSGCWGPR